MTRHDQGGHFWGLILPHGLLELTAVFVAAGVGLRLFWSWVEPGELDPQPVAAPARAAPPGRSPSGLVAVLLVSGLIEALRDPVRAADLGADRDRAPRRGASSWPTSSSSAAAPSHRGHTGDLDAALLEDRVATQA